MDALTALIHGGTGVGKSWLLDTMISPRLIFDAEGGSGDTPSNKIEWKNVAEPPPEIPEGVDTVRVIVRNLTTLNTGLQWLESGKHSFKSVGIDSVTELQKRVMDKVVGTRPAEIQDWGVLLREMESLVRRFRDLTFPGTNKRLWTVAFITGERNALPHVQGQLADTLPYFVDVVGLLTVGQEDGALVRKLLIQPIDGAIAKDRTHKLTQHYGPVIKNPDFAKLLKVRNGRAEGEGK